MITVRKTILFNEKFTSKNQKNLKKSEKCLKRIKKKKNNTTWKVSKYGVISGPYFPVFGLNMKI